MKQHIARSYLLSMLAEMQAVGSWCGETHLQKCTYLLRQLEGVEDLPFEFIIYKHGPYSFDLHDTISDLESSFFIERQATPPYGSHLNITPLGQKYIDKSDPAEALNHEALSAIAKEFSAMTVAELERYATAAYVEAENPDTDLEAKIQRLIDLKPHVNKSQAEESIRRVLKYLSSGGSRGGDTRETGSFLA